MQSNERMTSMRAQEIINNLENDRRIILINLVDDKVDELAKMLEVLGHEIVNVSYGEPAMIILEDMEDIDYLNDILESTGVLYSISKGRGKIELKAGEYPRVVLGSVNRESSNEFFDEILAELHKHGISTEGINRLNNGLVMHYEYYSPEEVEIIEKLIHGEKLNECKFVNEERVNECREDEVEPFASLKCEAIINTLAGGKRSKERFNEKLNECNEVINEYINSIDRSMTKDYFELIVKCGVSHGLDAKQFQEFNMRVPKDVKIEIHDTPFLKTLYTIGNIYGLTAEQFRDYLSYIEQ